MGTVLAFAPIPIPKSMRQMNNCGHVFVNAEP
jgi:hypothetical protein